MAAGPAGEGAERPVVSSVCGVLRVVHGALAMEQWLQKPREHSGTAHPLCSAIGVAIPGRSSQDAVVSPSTLRLQLK